MTRFFFHLDGPRRIMDFEGEDFSTAEAAASHARRVAWELARNAQPGVNARTCLVVTDGRGREVLRVELLGATETP